MMRSKIHLPLFSAVLVLAATAASAGITGTTGAMNAVSPPADVSPGVLLSDTEILVFQEQGTTTLGTDVSVNISQPGFYGPFDPLTPGTVSAGTVIGGSYFVHFDPLDPGWVNLTGSVSFDCPVIGVITLTAQVDASDGLGYGNTLYPTGTAPVRGLEGEEWVDLSADRLTLSMNLDNGPNGRSPDQIRVITACDVPGSEGCTPGYWKNHLESWLLDPGADFDATFGVDYFDPDITLGQAIRLGGGGVKKLARHGTAALLNAVNPGVNYPLSYADVMVAVLLGDAETLVIANELSEDCPAVSFTPLKVSRKNKKNK